MTGKNVTWKKPKANNHTTKTEPIADDANAGSFEESDDALNCNNINDGHSTTSSVEDQAINDLILNTDINMDLTTSGKCEWHSFVTADLPQNNSHHLDCMSYTALLQTMTNKDGISTLSSTSLLDEFYMNGDSEIKLGLDFTQISSLRLRSTSIMYARKIQNNVCGQPLRVLFDTGSDKTLINIKALPTGTSPKTCTGQRVVGVHGTEILNKEVLLEDISFPEFSTTQRIPGPIRAVVFTNTASTYDVIIGMDVMQTLGITVDCATKTISWNNNHVPFRSADYFKDPLSILDAGLFTDFESEEELKEAAALGYKSKTILHSKYEKVDTDEVARQQKHLTVKQQNDLKNLLNKYTKLFSGKLGKYPHRKVHLDVKPNAVPKTCRPYPVPKHHEQVFKDELDRLCEAGVLSRTGASAWLSPTFIKPKKDGRA